ncbi:hypothetical protein GCM10027277_40360 [Pseudoduganella ginsengisoli]
MAEVFDKPAFRRAIHDGLSCSGIAMALVSIGGGASGAAVMTGAGVVLASGAAGVKKGAAAGAWGALVTAGSGWAVFFLKKLNIGVR